MCIGHPCEVTIGHDGKGAGAGWYLDKVVINEDIEGAQEYVFDCDKYVQLGNILLHLLHKVTQEINTDIC